MRRKLWLNAAAVITMSGTTAMAQWTQWGGPLQDFKAPAKGLASTWAEDGPKKIWQRDLGDGYSGILVDGNRLYTMYRHDDREAVIALDAETGKTIWEHAYDSAPAEGHVTEFGSGPRSTPLLVGDRLITIGVSGALRCLNKNDGKVYWSHELWKDFKGNRLEHGYSSSPIAYRDTVITLVGADDASIVAFNIADGSVAWKNLSFGNSYSTPRILNIDGEDQLVTFMAEEIIGASPTTGELKWRYAHTNQWRQNVCMPIYDPESRMLFLSSPEAGSRGLRLTNKDGKTEIEEVWSTRKVQFYHVTAVNLGDQVYGSTGTRAPNFFVSINMKTGDIAWRERGFAKATCLYADGRFIILDEDGQLGLASVNAEGMTVHAKTKLIEGVAWTVPTVVGTKIYVRDKKTIMALDLGAQG